MGLSTRPYLNLLLLYLLIGILAIQCRCGKFKAPPSSTKLPEDMSLEDTPLGVAIKKEKSDIIQLLLDKNVNSNIQNSQGNTALHLAVEKEDLNLIKLLLEKGADKNITNYAGKKPSDIAPQKAIKELVL